jgi:hypothetical protein
MRAPMESLMRKNLWFTLACTAALAAALLIATGLSTAPRVKAESGGDSRVELGFRAAPIPLNMHGRDHELVGLGSYIVNVVADCNGCHSAGPQTEFAPGGNPYFNQPKMVNLETYLGGGRDFGFLGPPAASASAHIISRNLTPDASGLPEGGNTFDKFRTIMRTGVDMDHRHPTCPMGTFNSGCVPAPFDGNLLQVMPWPSLQDLSDHDLRAIYEYLKAVPCIQGGDAYEPANRCG